MDDEITCERCGSRVRLTVGTNGWPMLADAGDVAHVHGECVPTGADTPLA